MYNNSIAGSSGQGKDLGVRDPTNSAQLNWHNAGEPAGGTSFSLVSRELFALAEFCTALAHTVVITHPSPLSLPGRH